MRTSKTLTLLAGTLFAATPVLAETMVREVDVEVDMEALQNAGAAEHWAQLPEDLENAIVAELVGRTADDGAKITVDIDEVELANTLQSAAGVAESKLAGNVSVTHETVNSKFDNYDLAVEFAQAGPLYLPEADLEAITTDSEEYYTAMVSAFADRVVENLK